MPRLPLFLPVLALTLGACSGGSSSAAGTSPAAPGTVTVTTTVSPPASASASASASATGTRSPSASATGRGGTTEFVRVVRARVPDVAAGRSTAEIAAIATTACRSLRAGRPADAIQADARSLGTVDAEATDEATARELVKLAIDTVCLDQARRVDEF
jgi:hypothetical protein